MNETTPVVENAVVEQPTALSLMAEALKLVQADTMKAVEEKLQKELEDFQPWAENIVGLEEAIDNRLEREIEKEVSHAVERAWDDFEVDSDMVQGLDNAIEAEVQRQLEYQTADDIKGLDDYIDERVQKGLEEDDITTDKVHGLEEFVDERIVQFKLPAEMVQKAVEEALATPKVQLILTAKLQEAMVGVIAKFVGAAMAVPMAQPVEKSA